MSPLLGLRRTLAAAAAIAVASGLALAAGANAITVGYLYLVVVLLLAVWGGLGTGVVGSLVATACFNYFFLPPTGTFHVADRENWVALVAFLAASTIASRLVARERQRAAEAESRRREIQALYDLSLELFTAGSTPAALNDATARALRGIGAQSGGFLVGDEDDSGRVVTSEAGWIGSAADLETHRLLAAAPQPSGLRLPIEVQGRRVGSLVAYGLRAPRATVESLARLVALAVERERLLAERARLEALQESEAMKTALLRAVSHDLSTPLTAIALHLAALGRQIPAQGDAAATLHALGEATGRLERRVTSLLAMARFEAGLFSPRREPTPAPDLFRAAREHVAQIAGARRIETRVEADCPELDVDPSLVVEILVNLIENAHRASPAAEVIELAAGRVAGDPRKVWLEVRDRGHGLASPPAAQADGGVRRGLGLEIARSFAAAHGGEVTLAARAPRGVVARVELPAARLLEAAG
jgi:two-component system sensor histidine kinase KdpD